MIVGVLQLLNRSRALTEDDEEFLADISVHIGLAVENATRHLEILEKKRIEQQLALAREIIMIKSVRGWRLIAGVLCLRCPICLSGRVFTGLVGTRDHCDGCGYVFSHANRYFVGSTVFTWALTLAIAFGLFFRTEFRGDVAYRPGHPCGPVVSGNRPRCLVLPHLEDVLAGLGSSRGASEG